MIIDPFEADENVWFKANGLYLPGSCLKPPKPSRPIGIDLFAGAGGFSLGCVMAGMDVIAALEWEPACIHTYLVNLGAYPVNIIFIEDSDRKRMEKYLDKQYRRVMQNQKGALKDLDWLDCGSLMSGSNRHQVAPDFGGVKYMFVGDARKITGERILEVLGMEKGDIHCVFGGPPCQGFSTANSRRSCMDPRNNLVFEFARLVCEIQPKTCVMENVPEIVNMVTPEGIPVIDVVCRILSDGEYGPYETLRKTLLATSGAGALVKGKAPEKKSKPVKAQKSLDLPLLAGL